MNQTKAFAYYNAKEGIGYKSPRFLERVISKSPTMYDFRYMGLGLKMTFMKNGDDPEKVAEKNSFRKQKASIRFDYDSLNSSYATRVIPLSTNYFVSYTKKESTSENSNQDTVISKVINDNRTFYEKRIEKLEEELEDERRMSLTEKDLFLSKINELGNALKSRVQPNFFFY